MIVAGMEVRIDRKDIKNMHLYVKPPNGTVSVSAPHELSDETIERFVRTKTRWLKIQKSKFTEQLRQTERKYVSGETLYLWGKQYFLQVNYAYRNSLELAGDNAILTVREKSTARHRDNFVREWYREKLKAEITKLLPKWEKITGLKCSSWQTKYMKTKWGSCNIETKKIWFNLQLAKKPIECLEYIILHELIHMSVKNHNEDFVALMDKHMPFWREVKKKLNDQILDAW
ncbi:MAG: M48 family metallopeptidase [Candidatus Hodarchaeales archaeon]